MVWFMTNNKVHIDVSADNEIHNQILHLKACDGRNLPLLTLGNWQDGKHTSESALFMAGAVPSLSHGNNITDYRPLKGIDKF